MTELFGHVSFTEHVAGAVRDHRRDRSSRSSTFSLAQGDDRSHNETVSSCRLRMTIAMK
ncbi:hypothetical protein HanIR_Chr06g0277211 [Helianthus annuus]|nr:hypothetical protein HanIR_Chr06g0277211 [Helianthus annuus]